jgi:hypothetical protein
LAKKATRPHAWLVQQTSRACVACAACCRERALIERPRCRRLAARR